MNPHNSPQGLSPSNCWKLILWPPAVKSWIIWKDPDAGKDWGQEEKGMTEDEMVGWHHRLNGHEFGWTPGVVDGQGGLECWGPWGSKESDMTERLNWTERKRGKDWKAASDKWHIIHKGTTVPTTANFPSRTPGDGGVKQHRLRTERTELPNQNPMSSKHTPQEWRSHKTSG